MESPIFTLRINETAIEVIIGKSVFDYSDNTLFTSKDWHHLAIQVT